MSAWQSLWHRGCWLIQAKGEGGQCGAVGLSRGQSDAFFGEGARGVVGVGRASVYVCVRACREGGYQDLAMLLGCLCVYAGLYT